MIRVGAPLTVCLQKRQRLWGKKVPPLFSFAQDIIAGHFGKGVLNSGRKNTVLWNLNWFQPIASP